MGARLTLQTWGIARKIRVVDALVTPELQQRVREAHPEVSFAALAGGRGLTHRKKERAGELERLYILDQVGIQLDPAVTRAALGSSVGRDDVVDAAVCLATAWRVMRGQELVLPDGEPEYDARGLRMEIVA